MEKLVKRNVPIKKIFISQKVKKALGGTARQYGDLISGIDKEKMQKNQHSYQKNSGIKVKSQIQEDKNSGNWKKSRDDLQKKSWLFYEN